MKFCYTECVMVQQGQGPIYGAARIVIRVDDEGAGPYLVIRGDNNEAQDSETAHDFFLQSEEEIDQFAEVCKSMLRQADAADEITGADKNGQKAQSEDLHHAVPSNERGRAEDSSGSLGQSKRVADS